MIYRGSFFSIDMMHDRLGNEAFAAKNYDEAIEHYTNAIKADPDNAIYYSNRWY